MSARRLAISLLLLAGCSQSLPSTPAVDLTKVVVAQFDPANPIPVLRLVPTPTALVQDPATGDIIPSLVAPAPCEGASTKACLAFAKGGWPAATPITLYFSNALDPTTLTKGIVLLRVRPDGAPVPVPLAAENFAITMRTPPPTTCQTGGNGSNPPRMYQATDPSPGASAGVQVTITPTPPLQSGAAYALFVVSSTTGGLRGVGGSGVQPTALFSILNVPQEQAPVTADGTINDALLRGQVQSQVLAELFGGRLATDLNAAEAMQFQQAVTENARSLYALYAFFDGLITPLAKAGVVDRRALAFANAWTTSGAVDFDLQHQSVPFPNDQLLTRLSTVARTVLPALPATDPTLTSTTQALFQAINATLDGFSTTAPIALPLTADVDPLSIDPTPATPCTDDDCKIVMYPLDRPADYGGRVAGPGVPLIVLTSSAVASIHPASIAVVPAVPLQPNTDYVVAVKRGLKGTGMPELPLVPGQIFDLFKLKSPFVDMAGNVADIPTSSTSTTVTLKLALQCTTATTGRLAPNAVVNGLAALLETKGAHARFEQVFEVLEAAPKSIPRTELLSAFSYKTQSITQVVNQAREAIFSTSGWERLLGAEPTRVEEVFALNPSQVVGAMNIVGSFCVSLCQAGLTAPVAPTSCVNASGQPNPALANTQLCQTSIQLLSGNIGGARYYRLHGYALQSGGPFEQRPGHTGTFSPDLFRSPRLVDIPMWVVTPVATSTPAGGFPVVVFQHGLGRAKEDGFFIANTIARSGRATVMIDLPLHGERASDLLRVISSSEAVPCATDPHEITCQTAPGAPPTMTDACTSTVPGNVCDGRRDPSGTGFLGVNLFATRDNFRQATVDQLTLLRALETESTPGGPLAYLNGAQVGYIGQSLGSITGGNLAAYVTPDQVAAFALNVGGGGLANNIITHTIEAISGGIFAGLKAAGVCILADPARPGRGCLPTPAFNQFLILAQWVLDPGDPLATSVAVKSPGTSVTRSQRILMQIAKPDLVVPNGSSFALAAAYGFKPDDTDPHFQVYDFTRDPASLQGSGCHGFLLGPICGRCTHQNPVEAVADGLCNTFGAQAQAVAFVTSGGQSIIDPLPGTVAISTTPCAKMCP